MLASLLRLAWTLRAEVVPEGARIGERAGPHAGRGVERQVALVARREARPAERTLRVRIAVARKAGPGVPHGRRQLLELRGERRTVGHTEHQRDLRAVKGTRLEQR